ncbi:hypothetical protein HYV72_00235 [Candidatus Uhrbacteria bacterium]|nr:hypothetical protein [Candidatus Uhrbacteria bacterium]
MMAPFITTIITSLVCAIFVFAFVLLVALEEGRPTGRSLVRLAIAAGCLVVFMVSLWLGEYTGGNFNAQDKDTVFRIDATGRVDAWSDSFLLCKEGSGYRCIHFKRTTEALGHVAPITPNPKMRDIEYTVTVSVCDLPMLLRTHAQDELKSKKASETQASNWTNGIVWNVLKQQMYEMENAESNRLGALYNPLDKIQREAFDGIVEGFLTPRLESSGLCNVKVTSWTIR